MTPILLLLLSLAPQDAAADRDGLEFFEKKIRPVLVDRCYSCHSAGAKKVKGSLLLDTREGVLKGGDSGPAIVPGDPERSRLIRAIRYADDKLQMPPKERLAPDQVAEFETWVRRGAPDPRSGPAATKTSSIAEAAAKHWAFQPPKDAAPPAVRRADWVKNPVDAFVLAELEKRGLEPSPPADRRTLIRRASYDLTGLPPTAEEIEAFEADPAPDAYARLVDRLLASPRYGERWGRHWLDVARYADTKGYVYSDRDESRFVHSYVYRDWVIRAFNEDLPYDRFLVLQLAADGLLARGELPDKRDLAAMGLLTVGRRFINNIHDIIDDRIDTVARATMALTVSCARCHDHKFDPVPQADYYSLYGVFHSSAERTLPIVDAPEPTPEFASYEAEAKKRDEALRKAFEGKRTQALEKLRVKTGDYLAAILEIEKLPTEEFYQNFGPDDIKPFIARLWHLYVLRTKKAFHPVFAPWNAFAEIPERDLATRASAWLAENAPKLNPKVAEALSGAPPASMKEVAQRYGKLFVDVHKRWKEESKAGAAAMADHADEALRQVLYGAESPIAIPPGAFSEIEWFFDEGVRVELGKLQVQVDKWIIESKGSPPHAAILEDKPNPLNPRIFRRGNPANKGEEVPRRFLSSLPGGEAPFKEGSGRLEMARAIASPANPLTARVAVNRAWMHHFGAPIVRTPSDFGLRSEPPTHPELLDWLARRFVAGGASTPLGMNWSMKKLHRLLMLSSTYQQSSQDRPAARAIDPENRLLWRMNRRRHDLESLRDSLLFVSGELDLSLGGKPVSFAGRRRTVYGMIDRLNVPTLLRAFDFASVDAHSPMRFMTTVPQQALFMMNSPFVIDLARKLAARPEVAGAASPEAKVQALYRIVHGRAADPGEVGLGRGRIDAAPDPPAPPKVTAWKYGWGEYDPAAQKLKAFGELPHFTGSAWQGGPARPDPALGWIYLEATGGHAGNDLAHAAVRRWTAPRDGTFEVSGTVAHPNKEGDGVRARIVASRGGELASWNLKKLEAEARVKGLELKKGDTVDFIVDCRGNVSHDEFLWAPVVRIVAPPAKAGEPAEWSAQAEFWGPPPRPLSPVEKYAQALLLTNEFVFVD